MNFDLQLKSFKKASTRSTINLTRGGVTIEFSEMRGPNKIFGSVILQNEPNILFGPLNSENSIITPPLNKIVMPIITFYKCI